jgi:hypothetical protein
LATKYETEGHAQMDYAFEQGVNFLILLRCILFQQMKKPTVSTEELLELEKSGKREKLFCF